MVRKNGPLTVTDANLMLGRLIPEYFPKIFGKNEDQPLDEKATQNEFEKLAITINDYGGGKETKSIDEIAYG